MEGEGWRGEWGNRTEEKKYGVGTAEVFVWHGMRRKKLNSTVYIVEIHDEEKNE